jgi:cytosine/uracil/thiamine/allantoin permease
LALVVSLYFGSRGVVGQRIAADLLNRDLLKEKNGRTWETWEIVVVRYIQDFMFHFVCGMAGFLSLFAAHSMFGKLSAGSTIDAGAAAVFIFLALVGLVGVSDQLPFLLLEGKLPGSK